MLVIGQEDVNTFQNSPCCQKYLLLFFYKGRVTRVAFQGDFPHDLGDVILDVLGNRRDIAKRFQLLSEFHLSFLIRSGHLGYNLFLQILQHLAVMCLDLLPFGAQADRCWSPRGNDGCR
ncbi:hypothetical protein OAL12_03420 [Akkermansiaceae bacterium]|nr:hypothetical protein [Akkermansiaceae bacterium]